MNRSKSKYCSSISEGLKISTWLQGDQAKCLVTVKKAIKIFNDHLQSETCDCIAKPSNLLILSVDYYNQFLLSLEHHAKQVEEEEKKYEAVGDENGTADPTHSSGNGHEDGGITGSQFPNIEKSKPSRYSNLLLPQFVNPNVQQNLLKPLNVCIQYLREAFTGASSIPVKLIEGLRINTLLLTAHNIYNCYSQPDYRYLCARLMIELSNKILPDERESLLTAYHMLIRLYLDYNVLSKAEKFLKMAQSLMVSMKLKGYETYQTALIYLDQCEIEMRNGEFDKSGTKLQKFLQSDYLKKLTLNRYHLKGVAFLLASKFPSSYQFSSDYSEFIEPLHTALTIMKRWHRQLLYPDEKRPITVEDDHLWFKCEIYSFCFEVLTMIKTFYLNIGYPMELVFFNNCLFALTRRHCFLAWSTHIIKLSASIDMKCDKNECAATKLQLGILALTFKSSPKVKLTDVKIVESTLSKSTEVTSPIRRIDLDSELAENGDEDYGKMPGNNGPDRCVHDLGDVPAWEIEKILRKGNIKHDDEDIPVDEATIMKMLNSSYMKLPFPLNLRYLELVTLICCDKKFFTPELIDKILEISSTFTDPNHQMYTKLVKHLRISTEIFVCQGMTDVILMEAQFLNLLTDHYLEKREFNSIIKRISTFLSKISFPCINLAIRDLVGRLLLKLIVSKNQLLDLKPHFPEFDSKEVEEKMIRPILVCKTPPPVRVNINHMNAPERKVNYRMDELKDYAKSLHDAPRKNGTRKSSRILSRKSSVISERLSSTDSDVVIISENIEPPAVTPARRTRATAKTPKTPAIPRSKRTDPLTSTKKVSKRPQVDSFMDSLTDAIDCITIHDDIDAGDEDVFNTQQNLITDVIKGPSNIPANINNLKNLLTFYSNHPPFDVYSVIQYQLFILYSTINKPNLLAASYHLYECSNSAMVRYRAIFTRENKKRLKLPSELSIENLIFDPVNDSNFQSLSKKTTLIPETWRVIQICSCSNIESDRGIPDLLISRWQRNKKTLMVRIKGNPDKFTRNFMDEFYEIIELSNASIRKQDSQTFWTARTALNQRLEMLLQNVSDTWLGPFKSFFMGYSNDPKLSEFRAAIKKSIDCFFDSSFCRDEDLLDCMIEAFPILSKQQFETAICFLFSQFSFTILEECYHNCLEIFDAFYSGEDKKSLLHDIDFDPVGLIVNKPLEGFPFESLPNAVSANQQFFRIPSLRFLTALVETHMKKDKLYTRGVDHEKVYYLLNPSANLMKTEKRFRDKFLSQIKWKGVIGDAPSGKDLQSSLGSLDLYIYFGHGAGSRYYKAVPDGIDSLSIRTASLIVGCCSGKLFLDGSMFDSFGTPYRFMINGCPTYLGLLWDVTDGDIDRFADKLLSLWLPDWKQTESRELLVDQSIKFKELCKSLIHARLACRFKLLTGAAPVVYGLPISLGLHV